MSSLARQRSRLAVLAAPALVGSLLAVSAAPAAAVGDGKVSNPATYSACVGGATADAGFEDTSGSPAGDAVNCLAYYRITVGTSAGTYSPQAPVIRWQMALFLSRAAGPAGIVAPTASDQGFDDLDGLEDGIRDAINQVARLGIMAGRTSTSFMPHGVVTREDMAVHLAALLDQATIGPGGTDIGETTAARNGIEPENLDDVFVDVGDVKYSAYTAIRNLYEMGVASGTSATTFSPAAAVSRGQAAMFIARALAHTNARPTGLSVQTPKAEVFEGERVTFAASVRDSSFRPVSGALVDLFYKTGDDARSKAFKTDGTCAYSTSGPISACEITAADLATDAVGNITSGLEVMMSTAGTATAWLWRGESGDHFGEDTTTSVSFDLTFAEDATNTRFTDSLPENIKRSDSGDPGYRPQIKYGDTLVLTLQLIGADGDPVARRDASVTVRVQAEVDEGDDGGEAARSSVMTETHKTDSSGRIRLEFTENDPRPGAAKDDATTIDLTFSAPTYAVVNSQGEPVTGAQRYEWNDDTAAPVSITVKPIRMYTMASDAGNGASTSVRATLLDQYGGPVPGKKIGFTSSDADDGGIGETARIRHTRSNGVATLGYHRDSSAAETEIITATYTLDDKGTPDTSDDDTIGGGTSFYWTVEGNVANLSPIVVVETYNNTIVVDGGGAPRSGVYDSNDLFFIVDGNNNEVAATMADFEKELKTTAQASWSLVTGGVSKFVVDPA